MIIAPSKTQEFTESSKFTTNQPLLLKDSQLLIKELNKKSISELGVMMKMSERLAVQTHQRIHDFELPFTDENSQSAIEVFKGDVYSRICVDQYGDDEISYLQDHLCILSGLYGILRPLDLMQAYRLEMGCRLENNRGKNLYEFWGNRVTDELNTILKSHKEQVLVNLASAEYSRVINEKNLKATILKVDFKERKGDTYRTVAIHAKRARGMMVDFAVKNRVQEVTELKGFEQDDYSFCTEFSSENHYCFTRY